MSVQRRKDNKGRVLKTGETQRKDSSYMYRYSDPGGTRRTIYAPDLKTLREKEDEIEKILQYDLDYSNGETTIYNLVNRYLAMKKYKKDSTKRSYNNVLRSLEGSNIEHIPISKFRRSDAKQYVLYLYETGRQYSTIKVYKSILSSVFAMACEDEVILKNPFTFKLSRLIPSTSKTRIALTPHQVDMLIKFIDGSKVYRKYKNEILILLGTGLRISELYGLTLSDVDFKNNRIYVNHQLCYMPKKGSDKAWFVTPPKTESGIRVIPMSSEVADCLKNVIDNRLEFKCPIVVDGYTDFIFVYEKGLRNCNHLEYGLRNLTKAYNKLHADDPLTAVTPHVFRHTFCTNMINQGMNVKTVQYLMGHSNISTTLDVYAHANEESAAKDFSGLMKETRNNAIYVNVAG